MLVREQPHLVRRLIARSRRLEAAGGRPFQRGDLDAGQVLVIDRAARTATRPDTLALIDRTVVEVAQTKAPTPLLARLTRLIAGWEPLAGSERHRRAYTDRRVSVVQGCTGSAT